MMEENKQLHSDRKLILISVIILLLVVAAVVTVLFLVKPGEGRQQESSFSSGQMQKAYQEVRIDGQTYYQLLSGEAWSGDYYQTDFDTAEAVEYHHEVVSFSGYREICQEIDSVRMDTNPNQNPAYRDRDSNYIILSYANGYSNCYMTLIDCVESQNGIILYGNEESNGVMASGTGYLIVIPTKMPVGTTVEYRECYTNEELEMIRKFGTPYDPYNITIDKPVIYCYPSEETEISVKLLRPDLLTCFYPAYQDGWKVLAQPDGTLTDPVSGKNYYALYYESKPVEPFTMQEEGFLVRGEEAAAFLEEKLAVLGLNEKESEEFIIYWLPRLEVNEYNYIRFASPEEIERNMPLEIEPAPDTTIRIWMTFKGLDAPVSLTEQHLDPVQRNGFAVVEWGGSEIK